MGDSSSSASSNSSSSSSISDVSLQQQQHLLAWDGSVVVALQLTGLESMLLFPERHYLFPALSVIGTMLEPQTILIVVPCPEIVLQQVAAQVLPVMLDRLLPVVQHVDAAGEAEQEEGEEQRLSLFEVLGQVVGVLTATGEATEPLQLAVR